MEPAPHPSSPPSEQSSRRRGLSVLLTLLAWAVLLLVLYALGLAIAPDENPDGRCEGIGFGCALTPRDTVVFVGLLLGAPTLGGLLLLGGGLSVLLLRRTSWPGVLIGSLGALVGAGVVLAITVALIAGS
ncbi:hypothetical protein [Brachybacterium sp. GCM10030252]|uniref:hypothetical protein n=1 Tax=Brachybacterium sp. GCM10030252 TaxID=3273380 RepID=UPI00361AFD7A